MGNGAPTSGSSSQVDLQAEAIRPMFALPSGLRLRVGWLDGENLYLEPSAAYSTAQRLARDQGDSLAVSEQTLRRRLKEKGLLLSTSPRRETNTVRHRIEGRRREVLHLSARSLEAPVSSEPDQTDQPDLESPTNESYPTTSPTGISPFPFTSSGEEVGLVGSDIGNEQIAGEEWIE